MAAERFDELLAFEAMAGRPVRRFTYYRSWGLPSLNVTGERDLLRRIIARGTTPVLTFQPQDPGKGPVQPAYAHARICAGDFDPLLRTWAGIIAAAGGTVVVRLMHEANGDWYPWGVGVNGNSASSFLAAWHHVRAVMTGAGATNVRWQWSPNRMSKAFPLAPLFPGADALDEVGMSGYNGGTATDRGGWRSVETVFGETVREAVRLAPGVPLHLSETGCVEQGGDKAAWITELWAWLRAHPEVSGLCWFNVAKGTTDWRIETSPAATAAYRAGSLDTFPA